VEAIATVGRTYGQLLLAIDQAQAVTILLTSREAFQKLGRTQEAGQIDALSKKLKGPPEASAPPDTQT